MPRHGDPRLRRRQSRPGELYHRHETEPHPFRSSHALSRGRTQVGSPYRSDARGAVRSRHLSRRHGRVRATRLGCHSGRAYNGDGLLASRTVGGGPATNLLWDPATPLARLLQIGSDRIVYGLGPLYAVLADGTTQAFARDGMKSIRAEVSSTGAVTGSFRYAAYGDLGAASPAAATPTFLGYNGQLRDPSGLLYLRARWYDPATGRFLTRDPLRGDPSAPATLNAFGYAHANPMLMSDPSGLCPMCWGAVFGFVGYAIVTYATNQEFDWRSAAIATGAGALTAGASAMVGGMGFGAVSGTAARIGVGAVIGSQAATVRVALKVIEGGEVVQDDLNTIPAAMIANGIGAALPVKDPSFGGGLAGFGAGVGAGITSSGAAAFLETWLGGWFGEFMDIDR